MGLFPKWLMGGDPHPLDELIDARPGAPFTSMPDIRAGTWRSRPWSPTPEDLAEALRMGRSGLPMTGQVLRNARRWHETRQEEAFHLAEGCDNAVVDWYCMGWRDHDEHGLSIPYTEEYLAASEVMKRPKVAAWQSEYSITRDVIVWRTPIGMLWNLEERGELADEAAVNALLGLPALAIAGPATEAAIPERDAVAQLLGKTVTSPLQAADGAPLSLGFDGTGAEGGISSGGAVPPPKDTPA